MAAVLLLLYAVTLVVGGVRLALPGPESDDLSVWGRSVAGWHLGLVLMGVGLACSVLTAAAVLGWPGARATLAVLAVPAVLSEVHLAVRYLAIPSSSFWWLGVAGILHAPLLLAGVVASLLPAAALRGHWQYRRGGANRRRGMLLSATLLLAFEAADVATRTYVLTLRPRPESADLVTTIGLAVGVLGLGYLVCTVAFLLTHDQAPVDREPPWAVHPVARFVILAFAITVTATGMFTSLHPVWEEIGGLVTLYGLFAGLIGTICLVVTVPTLLRPR